VVEAGADVADAAALDVCGGLDQELVVADVPVVVPVSVEVLAVT